jgi:hypothetical protein
MPYMAAALFVVSATPHSQSRFRIGNSLALT